ncbi:hypothetical protein MCEMRE203_00032 [Candidatus Nanopelagicaceae bacterium]
MLGIMKAHVLKYLTIYSYFLLVAFGLFLFFNVRPVQDDYVSLRDMASIGLAESLVNMWQQWGGNVSVVGISNAFLGLHVDHFYFLGLALHSVITGLLLISTFRILHTRIIGDLKVHRVLGLTPWVVFSTLALSSFFSPGYVGIFNFTSASTAHLWSVLLAIHGLNYCFRNGSSLIFLLPILGFVTSNLNITEGLFGFSLTISALLFLTFSRIAKSRIVSTKLYLFAVGQFLGLLAIIAAPGFTNRTTVVGTPDSIPDLLARLVRVLPINIGDLIQHPGWILGILLGAFIRPTLAIDESTKLKHWILPSAIASGLLFVAICFADSFAYPSWYHTLSLYIFLFPLSFLVGACSDLKVFRFNRHVKLVKAFLVVIVFSSIFLFSRDMFMLNARSLAWDQAAIRNVCFISDGSTLGLIGPEIIYWPLNLGIEDVETWDWIRSAYIDWVDSDSRVQDWCETKPQT